MHLIPVRPLHDDVTPPRATPNHPGVFMVHAYLTGTRPTWLSGSDIFQRGPDLSEDVPFISLLPGEVVLVPLGFTANLPARFEAQIRPLGQDLKDSAIEVLDVSSAFAPDYHEEWQLRVRNRSSLRLRISHGQPVAAVAIVQFIEPNFDFISAEALTDTKRAVATPNSRTYRGRPR